MMEQQRNKLQMVAYHATIRHYLLYVEENRYRVQLSWRVVVTL